MAKELFYFLRKNPVNLLRYLPPFLSRDESFKDVEDVLSREHENLRVRLADFAKQFFIETATWSLPDWEIFVGVKKLSDDLEARRAQVKAKLLGGEVMTIENTNKLLWLFTDGVESYVEEMAVPNEIKFVLLDRVLYWQEMFATLREMMPAHLGFNFERVMKFRETVYVGNAQGRFGYKELRLPMPPDGLTSLYAGTALSRMGYRDAAILPTPTIYGNEIGLYVGQVLAKGGVKIIGADLSDLSNRPESFRTIKEAALADLLVADVGIARPSDVPELPEPITPEPHDEDDFFALTAGEWIRLYFDFPTGCDKPILMINPRGDLIMDDVQTLGELAASKGIFLNGRSEGTLGIRQADLIQGFDVTSDDELALLPSSGILRLFFQFPSGNDHKILLHNIRGGITIGELKELGRKAAASRLLVNAYGETTQGLKHAAVVKRFAVRGANADEPLTF